MKKIRKGDQVVVLSGRNKGRRGAVIQVLADPKTNKTTRVRVFKSSGDEIKA